MPEIFKNTVKESMKPGETIEQYRERLKQRYNMLEADDTHDESQKMSNATHNGVGYRKLHEGIGIAPDRYPTQLSLFRVWLMGTKDMPAEEAFVFHTDDKNFDTYLAEYSKWMYENRIKDVKDQPRLTDKEREEHAVNYYTVLKKATEKMKKMKLPDIDYMNKEEFEKHKDFFFNFGAMGVDFGQEIAGLTKNLKQSAKYINKVFGDKIGYGQMMDDWEGMATLGKIFDQAYDTGYIKNEVCNERNELTGAALKRYHLKKINSKLRGKTLGEYVENTKKDIINDFTFTKIIGDTAKTFEKRPMDDQIIDDYLTGKNNDFEVEYEKRLPAIKKDALLDVNDICNELADNFQISLTIGGSINEAINEIFEGDPSPEEMLRRMKETKAGRKIDERLNYAFYKLEDSSDGSTKFYCAAGITGIDRFRIDGRSPKELWGDKYASIKDANDRDMLIKTELFKELLLGNSQIVAENYVITNDNKIIKQGAYKLTYTPKEIESYRSFIAEVDALHENFEKVQKLFEKYQKDPEANFGGEKKEGSKLYRDMIKALKKCLDTTAGSSDATKEDIFKAIQEYQKTAETYYKERKGVVTGPVTSKGIVRLGLAEDAMNNLMERYDRLHILSEGLDLDVGKYDRAGRKAIRNIRYHIIRAEENRGRKLEHKDFKMEVVKKQPFYSENKKAKKKAAERNKNYTENPVYQQVKAAYPKTYMKNWCKALDGAEKIQMERTSNRSADEAHLPRNSKHSIVRSSNCSESPTKKSTFSRT